MLELPTGWRAAAVGDLCTLLNGLPFRPDEWSAHGLPIIRIQNLNGGGEFNRYALPVPEAYVIAAGTLLFSWSGNRGTSFGPYRWPGPTGILNQHIFKVTSTPDADPEWLYYALGIARQRAEQAAHGGSGLVHVRRGDLLGYGIATPPLPEQHQIAAILDTIDNAIRKTEQIIAKLQQVKRGLLHDLLTRGIDDNGELRDPERHPEQFKDSPLGRIPTDWRVGGFEDLVVEQGGMKPGPFGSALTKASFVSSGYRVYGQEQVLAGDLRHGDYYVREAKYHALLGFAVADGDILMTMVGAGTIGKVLIVTRPFEPGVINPRLMRIRLRPDVADARFVCELIRSLLVRRQFDRFRGGGTMPVLNLRILRAVLLPLLTVAEQRRIVGILHAHLQRSACEELALAKLRLLKEGLMEDLLTGRVRVTKLLESVAE
jgi:type I restriction enzyme, S subunit